MKTSKIRIKVNGEWHELTVPNQKTLLEVIRGDLLLTGTKRICDTGECGSCTVIMDGKAVNSCIVLAVEANGKEINTIEGLSQIGKLHPIQEEFVAKGAIQCGFCTPGMIRNDYDGQSPTGASGLLAASTSQGSGSLPGSMRTSPGPRSW